MDRIAFTHGDNKNIKPLIGMAIGGFVLVTNTTGEMSISVIGGIILVVNLLILNFSSKTKEALVIEDRRLTIRGLFSNSVIFLDDYENFEVRRDNTTRRIAFALYATNKRTKFPTHLLNDHYSKPIESIKDTIIAHLNGIKIETGKVEKAKVIDEYAYDPDDYKI